MVPVMLVFVCMSDHDSTPDYNARYGFFPAPPLTERAEKAVLHILLSTIRAMALNTVHSRSLHRDQRNPLDVLSEHIDSLAGIHGLDSSEVTRIRSLVEKSMEVAWP